MATRPKRPCGKIGCPELTDSRYCKEHEELDRKQRDAQRGTAHQRGYTARWAKYSRRFLAQPDNVFCKLQLDGCDNLAGCVDHIDPPSGPDDPRFWDTNNHQAACIRCNSVKGRRHMVGQGKPFEANKRR